MTAKRIDQLREFLKQDPEDPFLHYAIGQEYLKSGDFGQARAKFENLLKSHPDYIGTYYHLGKLLEKMEEPQPALKVYEKGIEKARAQGDHHSLNELLQARNFLLDDLED